MKRQHNVKSKSEKTCKCDAKSITIEAEVCAGRWNHKLNKEPGCWKIEKELQWRKTGEELKIGGNEKGMGEGVD